jgi:hypothetical protein
MNFPANTRTDILRCTFQSDPWHITSTASHRLTTLSNIRIAVVRAWVENAIVSAYVFLAFDQEYFYRGYPALDVFLLDQNGDEVVNITFRETVAECGRTVPRSYRQNFDFQYYDLIESTVLVMGAATWESC